MENQITIKRISTGEICKESLSNLLVLVVEDGASIGFLPPIDYSKAVKYWQNVPSSEVILLVAVINDVIVGSVQLHLCTKENGLHRAEIAKLMTHPHYRRKGIGRLLMLKAEEIAKEIGRTTIVLDTREGDPSNLLYQSLGFCLAGQIPHYAKSANGELHATNFYYKLVES